MDADTLTRAIRTALDETERIALRAGANHPRWTYDRETFTVSSGEWCIAARKDDGSPINDVDGEHIAHNDPAAVLRRVAADREIVDAHDREHYCPLPVVAGIHGQLWTVEEGPCYTLRALARGLGINPEEEEQ